MVGANTDVYGFLANLDQAAPGWSADSGKSAVVLGAGGAARAVVWALISRGFDPIIVVNRSVDRAERLANQLGPSVRATGWDDLESWLPQARILVNSTSLGMVGNPALDIDLGSIPDDAVVHDLVYVPLETRLLQLARARGLIAVDGLGMLLHQAVPGFSRWFGGKPKVTEQLRTHVTANILASR